MKQVLPKLIICAAVSALFFTSAQAAMSAETAGSDVAQLKWKYQPPGDKFFDLALDAGGDVYAGRTNHSAKARHIGMLGFSDVEDQFKLKWSLDYLTEYPTGHNLEVPYYHNRYRSFTGLIVKDNTVVARLFDSSLLIFVDTRTGNVLRTTPLEPLSKMSTQHVDTAALGEDGTLYFNRCNAVSSSVSEHEFLGVGFNDGLIKWQKQLKGVGCTKPQFNEYFEVFSPVIDAAGVAHISTQEQGHFNGANFTVAENGDASKGVRLPMRSLQSAVGDNGVIYTLGYKQANYNSTQTEYGLYSLNAEYPDQPAHLLYSFKSDRRYMGGLLTEPVIAGSSIYFADSAVNGTRYALSALTLDDNSHVPRWTFPFGESTTYHYKERVTATPAVSAGGLLYVGTTEALYAIDAATGEQKWKSSENRNASQLTIGKDGTLYAIACDDTCIVAIKGDGTSLAKGPWPKARGDAANTGRVSKSIGEPAASLSWIKAGQINATGDLPVGSTVTVTATKPNVKPTSIDITLPSGSNTHYRWPKYVADQLNNTTLFRAGVEQKDGSFAPQYSQYLNMIWSQSKDAKITVTIKPATGDAPTWKTVSAIISTGDLAVGSHILISLTDPEGHHSQKSFAVTAGANGHYEWPKHLADFINGTFDAVRAGEMIGKDAFTTLKSQYRNTLWVQPGYHAELTFVS
ncbi:PQQ-binding-like beta-propeller repeat protein [Glaciimonas sp. CA11.2]|uniref:outer membrane protein assembly factor BamB family protein n=2 Tax=Glaciimonas TaxID=1229970 RepID=UPI002AB461F7|nr:PQQ-binding-like beta-propeller repeat protein [Glaciimonas sp. CA11.2]MDY7548509.1 PQQ-binding-like beta-propeller repeat protein [Glaciimonas sp. CA11.2]